MINPAAYLYEIFEQQIQWVNSPSGFFTVYWYWDGDVFKIDESLTPFQNWAMA